MDRLKIVIAPHDVLKQQAKPVGQVTNELRKFLDKMLNTMYLAPGIGLAAPQVAESIRALVLDVTPSKDVEEGAPESPRERNPKFFINPEIIWSSPESNIYDEGCLSLPGHYAEVERPKRIRIRYLNYDGILEEIEADGLLATCLQHEMDHLNGLLFVDHISSLKRDMVLRKLRKLKKAPPSEISDTHIL